MVTFWNLKWWFPVNFHSSPGAAAWRSWAWSSWLVSRRMLSTRIGKGQCCFYPLHAHHLDKGLSYIIVWPDTEDEKHTKCWVSVTNMTKSVLFWRTWEHLVWGHHSPITLLYHLEFIQLQVTENPILTERERDSTRSHAWTVKVWLDVLNSQVMLFFLPFFLLLLLCWLHLRVMD